MRIKISFLKVHGTNGLVPLHHQKIISSLMEELIRDLPVKSERYNFSSLKGTSKVQNGQIRFLSSKVSLVISAPEAEFVQKLVEKIFDKRLINFAKLTLVPKSQQEIPDPEFQTVMKYVCISPLIPQSPFVAEENLPEPLNPGSHEFSDLIYDSIIERMERAGYSEKQLNQYAEFEITPDATYLNKMIESQKKFARIYKNNQNQTMLGYLLPFTMHAHPDVHQFIWDSGIGLFTTHGYGMIDLVGRDLSDK
jgi:CRISPR-associated endoribonuclease Cas6